MNWVPTDDEGGTSPPTKGIRSQAPDVTVAVGTGESKQEFKCYKVVLSFASPYLDAMLSSSMKEGEIGHIDFPDKDPEEWKRFYKFISPGKIGKANCCAYITNDNVMILLPWFNEFQMYDYIKTCDSYLADVYFSADEKSFWDKEQQDREENEEYDTRIGWRKSKFEAILGVLQLAHMYDLKLAKVVMEKKVSVLMDMLPQTHDLFDLATVKTLLQLVLPLELTVESGLRMKEGESLHLWPAFENIISPHISNLTQEIIDNEDHFPILFHSFVQARADKERAQAAEGIVRTLIHDGPGDLAICYGGSWSEMKMAKINLKEIISKYYKSKHNDDFKKLGIALPW